MRAERQFRLSRREALKIGGGMAAYGGLAALLNACGIPLGVADGPTLSSSPSPFQSRETATRRSTELPTPTLSTSAYPRDDGGFLFAGGPINAEERIRELGASGDIDKMQAMIVAELVLRNRIDPNNIAWVFGLNEEAKAWTMMAEEKSTHRFFWPKLIQGPEAGQLERSGNLFRHLGRDVAEDFFDLVTLNNPPGLGTLEQSLVGDKTGWFVAVTGVRKNQNYTPYLWFNADRDEWVPLSSWKPQGAAKVELRNDAWVGLTSGGEARWTFNPTRQEWVEKPTLKFVRIYSPEGKWSGFTFDINLSFFGEGFEKVVENDPKSGEIITSLFLRYMALAKRMTTDLRNVSDSQLRDIQRAIFGGNFKVSLPEVDPDYIGERKQLTPLLQDSGKPDREVIISPHLQVAVVEGKWDPHLYVNMPSYEINLQRPGKAFEYIVENGVLTRIIVYNTDTSFIRKITDVHPNDFEKHIMIYAYDGIVEPFRLIAAANNKNIYVTPGVRGYVAIGRSAGGDFGGVQPLAVMGMVLIPGACDSTNPIWTTQPGWAQRNCGAAHILELP